MRRLLVLSLVLLTPGCSDDLVLRSSDGSVELVYDCGVRERAVYAEYEVDVLRDYLGRVIHHAASRGDGQATARFVMLQTNSTIGLVEEEVVGYLCEYGQVPKGDSSGIFPGVGSIARDFSLSRIQAEEPFLDGETVQLSDFSGDVVVLDVFGTWCGPCILQYPVIASVSQQYSGRGVQVLGLLLNDTPERLTAWLGENGGMSFPFLLADTAEVIVPWGMYGAPNIFIVDQEGRIAARNFGHGPEAGDLSVELPMFLDSLLTVNSAGPF